MSDISLRIDTSDNDTLSMHHPKGFADFFRHICRLPCHGFFLLLPALVIPVDSPASEHQPLICFGNEPSWRLDMTEPGKAEFSTPDIEAVLYNGSATTLAPEKETIWRGQATVPDGGELVAFLREGACSDTMSETIHPYSANVSLPGGRHYAGCCRLSRVTGESATLENVTWRLTGLPGLGSPAGHLRNAITVRFEDGRLYGFSGCNQFIGAYTREGGRLVLGPLGGTMMACPAPAMSVERAFLESFAGTMDITLDGSELALTPAGGGDALRFKREPPPRLEGTQWEVTGYNNGRQAVVGPMVGTRLTLTFQDGQVSGESGCNRFRGMYKTEGKTLTIQALATTRKACEETVMVQEQEFLSALQTATTWDIVRGMLDVHRTDGERVLTANKPGE